MNPRHPPLLPPIVKTLELACTPERAWTAFTAEIHAWWPLATHSLAEAAAVHCAIEPFRGGRVFERDRDGREQAWGEVLAWEPPVRLRFTWRVGHAAGSEQEVEVRFEPRGGRTRVTLTHSGFELEEQHRNYTRGWSFVLDRFAGCCAAL